MSVKDEIVMAILQKMTPVLNQEQLARLKSVVRIQLCGYDIHYVQHKNLLA